MSGHGKREKTLMADATRWRARVRADVASATDCAALSDHRLSIEVIHDLIDELASCIAAGDDLIVCRRSSQRGRAAKFLAERGHVEITWDLVRPVGVREGELFG
jgi:hypothetical protein